MNRPTMTANSVNHISPHCAVLSNAHVPECWFDLSSGHDHNSIQSSTDAGSVSSASPTTVICDGPILNKPAAKPKRSLSAYNFFFQAQRREILMSMPTRAEGKPRRSHGKIGFADLARLIAGRWKSISQDKRVIYEQLAADDKSRYSREMDEWKKNHLTLVSPETCTRQKVAKPQQMTQSNSYTADKVQSRSIPDLILMSDAPSSAFGDDFLTMMDKPLPFEPMNAKSCAPSCPQISDLADKLDEESLEMLVNIFR